MRRLRLLLLVLFFCLLPAWLLQAGVDVWLSVVEERRNEDDLALMSRHLKDLRDDVTLHRNRLRVAREVRDRIEALPQVDEAGVRKVKAEFDARYPRLLDVHVFAPARTGAALLELDGGRRQRFALGAFADFLGHRADWRRNPVGESKLKIVQQTLFGLQVTPNFVYERRDDLVECLRDKASTGVYWDGAGASERDRSRPERWRALVVVFLDLKEAQETYFGFETLLSLAREKAAADRIAIEARRFRKQEEVDRAAATDPALSAVIRRTLTDELRVRGEALLHVLQAVRESDKLVLHATKRREDSFPGKRPWLLVTRTLSGAAALLAALLFAFYHEGRMRLFLPVRVQMAALFVLAALVPYAILLVVGMDQVLGTRAELLREAASRIMGRIQALEDQQVQMRGTLFDLAVDLRDREAAQTFRAWSAARAAGSVDVPGSGEVALCETNEIDLLRPVFAPLDRRIHEVKSDSGIHCDAMIFDADGRMIYRDSWAKRYNQVEQEFLGALSVAAVSFHTTGSVASRKVRTNDSFLLRLVSSLDSKGGAADAIVRNRGVLHTIEMFNMKMHIFLEPINDANGRSVATLIMAFAIDRMLEESLSRAIEANWKNEGEEIKLAMMHRSDRTNRRPNDGRMTASFFEFLARVAEERTPREGRVEMEFGPAVAAARPLGRNDPFAVAGVMPLSTVERAFDAKFRLFLAVVLAGFVFSVALGLWIAGRIVRSIRTLADGVRLVERGELGTMISLESPDEFGRLAGAFNLMSGNLSTAMHRLERRILEITTLYSVNQSISFTRSWNETLRIILDKAVEALAAEKGSLMLWNAESGTLEVAVIAGRDGPIERRIGLAPGEGLAGRAYQTGETQMIADAANDARFLRSNATADSDAATRTLLCVPLKMKDQVLGVINITNRRDGKPFAGEDLTLVEALATQAAVTIENARLYDLSITDGMTGLYINRYFQVRLDEELKRAARYGTTVALLFTDVDHFKNFNDKYGHQTGDRVLIHVAQVMRRAVRDVDIPCRYGGEEFAVIAPNTDLEGSRIVAERMRRMVEEMRLEGPAGEPLSVTISIGVSVFPADAADPKTLVGRADEALYHAKRTGRNRCAYAGELPDGEAAGVEDGAGTPQA